MTASKPPVSGPEGLLSGAPEPEVFVDDGLLVVPDAIGEEVEIPLPIEPEVDPVVVEEMVEDVQETQGDIVQEIYEEIVAGELPDFPDPPPPTQPDP